MLIDFKSRDSRFLYCDPTLLREAVSPEEAEGAVAEAAWLRSCLQSMVQSNPVLCMGRCIVKSISEEISPKEEADYAVEGIRGTNGFLNLANFRQLCKAQHKLWKR